ncbi:DMT family transporter [Pseudomonas sp. H9]|uniref:DMT family transporter n=1 Tax=Pseudomonas sp. H9 TaxID=483968 RepID=UPI001057E16A|nr:DMT family transporter [Pseudomonas sp. H9]TDF82358.1 DMT family transporter [Pseudomonas sp. H9]
MLVVAMTSFAMLAFAANSLLTRMAFQTTAIDATAFTAIRVVSGALTLWVIAMLQGAKLKPTQTGWWSGVLLFTYVAAFSFAYRDISTGAGALVLFASAQLLMISYGYCTGERTSFWGVLIALGGIAAFLAPSASAPPLSAAALMAVAGFAWGGFSLLGRSSDSPISNTAASFLWAVPLALILMFAQREHLSVDTLGGVYALLSGSLASAIGYAIWYWVRVRMTAISAGAVQLSVPVLSAALGVLILSEEISWIGAISALITLGGVAWVTLTAKAGQQRRTSASAQEPSR